MYGMKKALGLFLVTAMLVSMLFVFDFGAATEVKAVGSPITMMTFGSEEVRVNPWGGDTWDHAWLADDRCLTQSNDVSDLGEVVGSPENPGSLSVARYSGNTWAPDNYTSGIYEVDGVFYMIPNKSVQGFPDPDGPQFTFLDCYVVKSVDNGYSFIQPPTGTVSWFPRPMASVTFVKYGRGGVAPAIDNAQTYVYFLGNEGGVDHGQPMWGCHGDHAYLARMRRTDLPTLDKTKVEFYKGGDGMLASSWTTNFSLITPIYSCQANKGIVGLPSMVYNAALEKYILNCYGEYFQYTDGITRVLQGDHPWGPFTPVMDDNFSQLGRWWTWPFLTQKFISADGKKMWISEQPKDMYSLAYQPYYLTTNPVQTYQAEDAALSGAVIANTLSGYTGSGYITDLDQNDSATFTVNVGQAGAYMMRVYYHNGGSLCTQNFDILVNGVKNDDMLLGNTDHYAADHFLSNSYHTWLNSGNNTIRIENNNSAAGADLLGFDKLDIALYSITPGSLPGCYPAATPTPGPPGTTKVNDTDGGITYSGSWTYSNSSTGYYNNDCHFSYTAGNYAQYTFNGTSIKWIGAKNNNHGKVDIYIDGNLDVSALSTYDSSWLKQLVLYEKTGLTNGPHTMKIVLRTDKDPASSGYYQDVDAFEYYNSPATPTPAPTATPTPGTTKVNDTDGSITYSDSWTYKSSYTGYYNSDCHYSNTAGSYAQYTFSGTSIKWIGAKNNDHGKVDIYIDGNLDTSGLSTYDPSWPKQLVLYQKTGLINGQHTIKIVLRTDKDPASSGYYQDVDAFEYTN